MLSVDRFEETTTKVIFSVPSPSPWADIAKALMCAKREYAECYKIPTEDVCDDAVMVESWDDEIRIWFHKEVKKS
jgi:hypothetical protein